MMMVNGNMNSPGAINNKNYQILHFHTNILKYLIIWPNETTVNLQKRLYIMYGCFFLSLFCAVPICSAAIYQFYVKIEDVHILLESLIGVHDIIGNTATYLCFLKNQQKIQEIINEIKIFVKYCGEEAIKKTDAEINKYTKYLVSYVSLAVIVNLIWPMLTINDCISSRGSQFYIKHDPCGMPTQNMYPFDSSQGKLFWIFFIIEAFYCYHTCCFFSLATTVVVGFLKHIIDQLRCCSRKFEEVFNSDQNLDERFKNVAKYHQEILNYAEKVFNVFSVMVIVYVGVTSFALAIIGYQISSPKTNSEDRIRYGMLLIGWTLLFYSICYYGQLVRDESMKIGDSLYNSKWCEKKLSVNLRNNILIVTARTRKNLDFQVRLLGGISLVMFVAVVKRAYQVFALLVKLN